jgi:hypothetical protein
VQAVILDDVDEFRGGADDPDQADRPERHHPQAPDRHHPRAPDGHQPRAPDAEAFQVRVDLRSRTEYAADLEQRAVSGWDQRPFRSFAGDRLNGASDEPIETVRRFEPSRAGLPDPGDAVTYLDARQPERPWLAAARGRPPEVQRLFAALDQGGGHAHIRHEGWVTEEMNRRRAACLEDPAQLDPAKREAGIDGLKPGGHLHHCRQTATRIADPDAFATAFAKGVEHPKVRAALEATFDPDDKPRPVQLPIGELLGPDGHRYCTGWRLEPVDGSMAAARRSREAWMAMPAEKRASNSNGPTARPVETFEGGVAVFVFGHNSRGDGYEVVTMYPRPPAHEH